MTAMVKPMLDQLTETQGMFVLLCYVPGQPTLACSYLFYFKRFFTNRSHYSKSDKSNTIFKLEFEID